MARVRGYIVVGAGEALEELQEGFENGLDGGLAELDEGRASDLEDAVLP